MSNPLRDHHFVWIVDEMMVGKHFEKGKSFSNIPYFNPEAFARPAYGKLGNAPRTLDWMRTPGSRV